MTIRSKNSTFYETAENLQAKFLSTTVSRKHRLKPTRGELTYENAGCARNPLILPPTDLYTATT